MKVHVDPHIRDTYRVFPAEGRGAYLRYDMNENPEGLPAAFVQRVLREITPEFLATYPEPSRFLGKYASFLSVQPENLLAVNGSDMAIRYLMETFGEEGKEIVSVAPTFEMYGVNASILGYRHVTVPYDEALNVNVDDIVSAIGPDVRIVFLTNPNNPIGNVYTQDEIRRIADRAEEVGAVVVVDEAYHYFYPESFVPYALTRRNMIVLRTFSKLFSIAALRLGIIIADPELIGYIRNAKLTFDANSVALLFAERIIEEPGLTEELIRIENEGKAYVLQELEGNGYECRDCRGNFIFVRTKKDAHRVEEILREEKKLLVHAYRHPLLRDFLRVSVGSRAAMERFLKLFYEAESEA
ncbi:MAG: aminotransferase class I/II-fold pyridoxal phosphate-dependent enzyme [Lachnospiraceae bacterium]|nr:aminotransferase class I/II-fold pyridoxal phosphate-dependent enzyme [Lachnospiraceae bacterium]